jgi:hypothetical protein
MKTLENSRSRDHIEDRSRVAELIGIGDAIQMGNRSSERAGSVGAFQQER